MLTEKQLTDIYEREMENQPSAGLDVTTANKNIRDALDDYCAALTYEAFLWAYALGYEAGRMESEASTAEDCFSINKKER